MKKKNFTKIDIYLTLIPCLIFIGICVLLNYSLVIGFALSLGLIILINNYKGFTFKELFKMMIVGLGECKSLYILIILIGAMASILLSSGIVPSMIFYGFKYMKNMNFLFGAFVIVSLCSIFMGTAVGTISTIGVAVLGIGRGFGVPVYILLGAIVSGAFIADKVSPISGLLNLTLSTTEIKYKHALKNMLVTLIPTIAFTGGIYFIIGRNYIIGKNCSEIIEFQNAISSGFHVSPYLMLLPIFIVVLSVLGVKIIYSIITGLVGGGIISVIIQGNSIVVVLRAVIWGYKSNTSSAKLNEILISGGVVSMIEVLMIVVGAIALTSILEGTGLIDYITEGVIEKINSIEGLILNTFIISSVLTIVTCDQTMGIILPGRLMRKKYDELGVSRSVLARTISDTGTVIAPLMPWNVNALIISLITGIKFAYAPFAVLCYVAPVMTLVIGLSSRYTKLYTSNRI